MWIFPKYKTTTTFGHAQGQYGAFNKNVRRNWGVWPMWISSANDKGFLATSSTIVYDDRQGWPYSPDGRTLWSTDGISGSQWYGCDFDDLGYSYFSGPGTVKRDIMPDDALSTPTSKLLWTNYSTQSGAIDYSVRYNNGYLYIGSNDFYEPLRKVDTDGNTIWRTVYNTSNGLTSSHVYSIAFDESNNIYVCGRYVGGIYGGFIAKYNESGTQLWSTLTDGIMYDIKFFNSQLYLACAFTNNPGANDGAIHLRGLDGTDLGYTGTKLDERGDDYYNRIEVNNRYMICSAPQGDAIDVYNLNINSWTASYIDTNLMEITDLELYGDNLYFCDRASFGGPPTIYRLNATFSRIEESWQVSSWVNAIRMKKTY